MDSEEVETVGTGGLVDDSDADGVDNGPPAAPGNLSPKETTSTLDRVLVQILAVSSMDSVGAAIDECISEHAIDCSLQNRQ